MTDRSGTRSAGPDSSVATEGALFARILAATKQEIEDANRRGAVGAEPGEIFGRLVGICAALRSAGEFGDRLFDKMFAGLTEQERETAKGTLGDAAAEAIEAFFDENHVG